MGSGSGWRCKSCGAGEEYWTGCGMMSFDVAETRDLIAKGELGEIARHLLSSDFPLDVHTIDERAFYRCPGCGKPIHFEAWTLLNAQKSPEAAQRLIEGNLSEFTCPSCGYTSSLAHPCLYLDPEHNVFIYSVLDDRMAGMAEEMFAEQPEGRRCRIVTSRLQLQDKAAIFMAGLDDRPMEILKTGLTGQAKLQGLVAEGEKCEAYFIGIGDDSELVLDIEISDSSFTSSIEMGGHNQFASNLSKSSMADDEPLYVDRDWAYKAIDAIEAKESNPSQRHQIRYFFEHKLPPQLFFEDKGEFINAVLRSAKTISIVAERSNSGRLRCGSPYNSSHEHFIQKIRRLSPSGRQGGRRDSRVLLRKCQSLR